MEHLGTVFPDDNRVRVTPTTAPPFYWVGQLDVRFPSGVVGVGTATMIDSYYVLTCAHNLFQSTYGGWAREVRFTLALDGGASPYRPSVEAANAFVPEEYRTQSPPWPVRVPDPTRYIWDFGLVQLQQPRDPSGTDLFPAMVPLDDGALDGAPAQIAGYPGDKPPGEMWNGSGPLKRPDRHLLFYGISTAPGQSGASVRLTGGVLGTPRIVGIHVAGMETAANFAVRVTTDVVNRVAGWMAGSATAAETADIAGH